MGSLFSTEKYYRDKGKHDNCNKGIYKDSKLIKKLYSNYLNCIYESHDKHIHYEYSWMGFDQDIYIACDNCIELWKQEDFFF